MHRKSQISIQSLYFETLEMQVVQSERAVPTELVSAWPTGRLHCASTRDSADEVLKYLLPPSPSRFERRHYRLHLRLQLVQATGLIMLV
jgi:hypothetical protein